MKIRQQINNDAAGPPGRGTPPALAVRAWRATFMYRPVLFLLAALVIGLSLGYPGFRTTGNLQDLLNSSSILWLVSLGMTFALISGGADLSVGATGSLAGIFLAKVINGGLPAPLALVLVLLAAAALGAATNGALIGIVKLSFFVVTLATMTTFTGILSLWSGGKSLYVDNSFISSLAFRSYLGIQLPVWIMIGSFGIALWVQRKSYFGRDVYATGGNLLAARLSGIRVERTLLLVYAITAATAAAGGILSTSRIGVAVPTVDSTLPLLSIAAVVLGGSGLTGGAGGVVGTALGVLFIGVLQNGLSIAGLPSYWQQVITGVILVAAVAGDRVLAAIKSGRTRSALRRSPPGPQATPRTGAEALG